MAKFKIKFNHIVEETYIAKVESDNEESAKELFNEDPFEYVEDFEPTDVQGLDIKIISIEKIKENLE